VSPLGEADFEGRVVMEVGCGTGRWAVAVAGWGAREVLAVDFSEAVEVAFRNARGLPNLHVIQADLHRLPLRRGTAAQVDVGMSIGVLHCLVDPARGLQALADVTRPGGTVFSWVYAAEGNEWLARCLSPLRSRVTSRLPLPVVSGLALLLSAALHPLARMVARGRAHALPYRDYFEWLAGLPFSHTHAVVHDHLSAPLTHYVTRGEFEGWFRESDLPHPRIRHRNANSWSGLARRPSSPGAMR
jgi:SAM-dependent methyltransferase